MNLRDLQKLAHELRPYSDRICRIASLTDLKFRATPEGIVVAAGWGTGQLRVTLSPEDLSDRPCDSSLRIARWILAQRLEGETTDATTIPDQPSDPSG